MDAEEILEQCFKFCEKWQKRLRLQDWHIEIAVVDYHRMSGTHVLAEIHPVLDSKYALMQVLNPEQIGDDWSPRTSLEECVIHELLHLHFVPFGAEDGTPEGVAEEQAVSILGQSFMAMENAIAAVKNLDGKKRKRK